MKKWWIGIIVGLLYSQLSFSQANGMRDLIGNWEVVDSDNSRGLLEVLDSNTIYLAYGGERKQIVSYKADFKKSPASFQFSLRDSSSVMTLSSQMLFINKDLIEWRIAEETSPAKTAVQKEGNIIYLRRRK